MSGNKPGPSTFTRYLDWVDCARDRLGMSPADQYSAWRVWWREFVHLPPALTGVKAAGRSYTDCTGLIPDEVAG